MRYLCLVASICLLLLPSLFHATRLESHFSTEDVARIVKEMDLDTYSDLPGAFYSTYGLTTLGKKPKDTKKLCEFVKAEVQSNKLDSVFYAYSTDALLGASCKVNVPNVNTLVTEGVKEGSTVAEIFHATSVAALQKIKVTSKSVGSAIIAALKKDDTAINYAYALHSAYFLDAAEQGSVFDLIEDVVNQADEENGRILKYESGGLFTTAMVIDGIYKLSTKMKKIPAAMTEERVIKFANYFLSRKNAHQIKALAVMMSALNQLATNQFHNPITVALASDITVQREAKVQVRVCDIMGKPLQDKLTLTAEHAKNVDSQGVIMSRKSLDPVPKESSLFELDMWSSKPPTGFYKIALIVSTPSAKGRLIGLTGHEIEVKVTTKINVESATLSVSDRDQTIPSRSVQVPFGSKEPSVFEADFHQKLVVKFRVVDSSNQENFAPHQVFARLLHKKSGKEIQFVIQHDLIDANVYEFDLDVHSKHKEFLSLSGPYDLFISIGGAMIDNPIDWHIAEVQLKFRDSRSSVPETASQQMFSRKPDIKHMFREPEKRPPTTLSLIFTGLVLLPFLIMFLLWAKLGVNVSNVGRFGISAIGFHAGLGGILMVFVLYWLKFNMFDTLRYTFLLGIVTFFFGNRLLSGVAAHEKSSVHTSTTAGSSVPAVVKDRK